MLIEKHGVMVAPGQVAASDFVKARNTKFGQNSYFGGSWEELEALAEAHLENWEPGVGSVDGDVRLVNVPPANFYTSVAELTPANVSQVETIVTKRREGEAEYSTRILRGKKPPAKTVQLVLYRADVLAQDNDRSSAAEWEIVSINAGPGYYVPMAPSTMKRNSNREVGGTYREYTQEQWDEAYEFWDSHVSVLEEPTSFIYESPGTLSAPLIPESVSLAQAYLASDPMAQYLDDNLKEVVEILDWLIQDDGFNYIVRAVTSRALTQEELDQLAENVSGQNSDGLGEGFEQQDFASTEDERMISFDWNVTPFKLVS